MSATRKPVMSGILLKKDDFITGLWTEQFFVLDPESRRLAHYSSEPATLNAGGGSEYRLTTYENIEERGGTSRKFRLNIHVEQSGREKVLSVAANTQQDKIAWIQALAGTDDMGFICPQCYKAFKMSQDLVGHFEQHQPDSNADTGFDIYMSSEDDDDDADGKRFGAASPEVNSAFEPIQFLDDYAGDNAGLSKRGAELLSEMVQESETLKELVNNAQTREDLMDMNHHYCEMLSKLPLPTSDLEGLTLKQANKDASRERFIVNGRLVEGAKFWRELKEKVAPLDTAPKTKQPGVNVLPAAQYVYFLTSRTIWDGDIYFVSNSIFVEPSLFNLIMQVT